MNTTVPSSADRRPTRRLVWWGGTLAVILFTLAFPQESKISSRADAEATPPPENRPLAAAPIAPTQIIPQVAPNGSAVAPNGSPSARANMPRAGQPVPPPELEPRFLPRTISPGAPGQSQAEPPSGELSKAEFEQAKARADAMFEASRLQMKEIREEALYDASKLHESFRATLTSKDLASSLRIQALTTDSMVKVTRRRLDRYYKRLEKATDELKAASDTRRPIAESKLQHTKTMIESTRHELARWQQEALEANQRLMAADQPNIHAVLPNAPQRRRLYLINAADGETIRRFTDLPQFIYQGAPDWAPEGDVVAFEVRENHRDGSKAQIAVTTAEGKNPRVLIDGSQPSLSPRGSRMVFCRKASNSGIWITSTGGAHEELLQIDELGHSAVWSPDGTRIAYVRTENDRENIHVVDLVEGTRHTIYSQLKPPRYRHIDGKPAWSPNSEEIAFRGELPDAKRELVIVSARGAHHGERVPLKAGGLRASLDWSQKRGLLINLRNNDFPVAQLFELRDKPDSYPQHLPGNDIHTAYGDAIISPDDQKILCTIIRPD